MIAQLWCFQYSTNTTCSWYLMTDRKALVIQLIHITTGKDISCSLVRYTIQFGSGILAQRPIFNVNISYKGAAMNLNMLLSFLIHSR